MRLSTTTLGLITATMFFGSIGLGQLAGVWRTESSKIPATYTEGAFTGEANPADIRGSYTFSDIEIAFGIDAPLLGEAFAVEEPEHFAIKGLEERYGIVGDLEIGTDAVRLFVARYLDRPYEPEETTGIPESAFALLSPAQRHGLEARVVRLVEGSQTEIPKEETLASAAAGEDRAVKGMTTLAELYSWGVMEQELSTYFGGTVPSPSSLPLRDAAEKAGVEFSTIKTKIQDLVNETPETLNR